jgi:spermidine synthase
MWCFVFLSEDLDPLAPGLRKPVGGLKYYNPEIHRAAFALPNFLKTALGIRR